MKPVIAIDVDGVLLLWQTHALKYCIENKLETGIASMLLERDIFVNPFEVDGIESPEHIIKYNESKYIEYLKPYRDAVDFVRNNKDEFDFIAITAMSPKVEFLNLRKNNLESVFGCGVFKEILGCNIRESKSKLFMDVNIRYGNRIVAYIDDMAKHINDAYYILHPKVELFHLVRDVREPSKVPCKIVSDLRQIVLEK